MSQTARGFGAICKTSSKIRTQKLLAFVVAIAKWRGGLGGVRVLDLGLWDEGLGLGIDV